jgi:hypothetical protein
MPTTNLDSNEEQRGESADINLIAHGDRRLLEALYLELCELVKQKGLKIEFQLTKSKPDDRTDF